MTDQEFEREERIALIADGCNVSQEEAEKIYAEQNSKTVPLENRT